MPKFICLYKKRADFNKTVNKRPMDFNVEYINLLLILVFPLVPYIKIMCFSVVGTTAFKENLGKIMKRETINNKKVNEAKLSSVMFTLKYINILP